MPSPFQPITDRRNRDFLSDPARACRDFAPETFFPEQGDKQGIRAAKAVCYTCPFISECLEYALSYGDLGVWGGTTEGERRGIRSKLAMKRSANEQRRAAANELSTAANVPAG